MRKHHTEKEVRAGSQETNFIPTKMEKHNTKEKMSLEPNETNLIDWQSAFGDLIEKFSETGAALRGFRLREGWTQTELAEKIEVNQANLSKMEHGKRPIGKQIAKRLASLFKTDYRIFL